MNPALGWMRDHAGELRMGKMLPLSGKRILVTRAKEQASALAAELETLGAEVVQIPAIEIAPPASYCALDAALSCMLVFDWVVFTSANAVECLVERGRRLGLKPRPRRIAVIGPATASAVYRMGMAEQVDLMPKTSVAEVLAEELVPLAAGKKVLLVRAEVAREVLPETLRDAGCELTIAAAYRNVVPPRSVRQMQHLFQESPPDAITFTSSSTAQNLAELLQQAEVRVPGGTALVSIGPITSHTMREVGLAPTVQAKDATMATFVETIRGYFAER